MIGRKSLMFNQKRSFTLAEVLITLAIIGVVAALTIPNLIVNHQKQQVVSSLYKNYAILKQAVQLAEAENGPIVNYNVTGTNRADMKKFMDTYFIPYLKVKTDCTADANNDRCTKVVRKLRYNDSDGYWDVKNKSSRLNAIVLENEALVAFFTNEINNHVVVVLDINGDAPPNRYSKDVFWFGVSFKSGGAYRVGTPGFYPWGAGHTRNYLFNGHIDSCHNNGWMCAAVIFMDGKISKDYNW